MSKTTKFFNSIVLFFLSLNLIFSVLVAAFTLVSVIFFTGIFQPEVSGLDLFKSIISQIVVFFSFITLPTLYVFVSYQIYKFFKKIEEGSPFDPYNGIRLRWVGMSFTAGSVYMIFFNTILGPLLSTSTSTLGDENLRGFAGISAYLPFLIVGLMFLVIAEAFIQGSKLSEENKLTV